MKTPLRLAAVLVAALLLTSCSPPSPEPAAAPSSTASATAEPVEASAIESLPFNAGGFLGTNATPNFPDGEPGEVSVVQVGPLKVTFGASLLFAFRNNTSDAISHVDWTATARSDGAIVATGSSQGTIPAVVQPGEVGLSYIFFENGESIPDGSEYEFDSSSSRAAATPYNTAPMTVTESNVAGDAIVGTAVNNTGEPTVGPYSVQVYCFEGDNIVDQMTSYAEQDALVDGATGTFTVSLYGAACPSYALGMGGYYS